MNPLSFNYLNGTKIVRGQLDMSGNLIRVEDIHHYSQVQRFWVYGSYVYFIKSHCIVITVEDAIYELTPPNMRLHDTNYRSREGEDFSASSNLIPFIEALKSGEVSTRSGAYEGDRVRKCGRG